MTDGARTLHWVHKIGDYQISKQFYQDTLGMTEQRHELFDEGCEAFCNGRYRTSWSKTMIGYGTEDKHFVLELTANSGIKHYALGNDYRHIAIAMDEQLRPKLEKLGDGGAEKLAVETINSSVVVVATVVRDPDQYPYWFIPRENIDTSVHANVHVDPVLYVSLSTTDLNRVHKFYVETMGMQVFSRTDRSIMVGYDAKQTKLEFVQLDSGVDLVHGEAFGRLAIATPDVHAIHELVKKSGIEIVTGPIVLSTPNKADVEVIIIKDLDGYEICYVGDEGFYKLALGDSEQ